MSIGRQISGLQVIMMQFERIDLLLTLQCAEFGGVVSIPRKFQEKYHLDPRAAVDPDDSSKVFYLVSGFHELHCLVRQTSMIAHQDH